MTPLPLASPQSAAQSYRRAEEGFPTSAGGGDSPSVSDFGNVLNEALQSTVATAHEAEQKAADVVTHGGDLTQVVMAVSKAELALQTATTLRDRMVQAYQEIMRMPI